MPSSRSLQRRRLADVVVRPPERPSNGAQAINALLEGRSRLSRRLPVLRQYRTLINWGNSNAIPERENLRIINKPKAVAVAINKLSALSAMQAAGVRVPDFNTQAPDGPRDIWLARSALSASGGVGISIVRKGEPFPAAPLYVKYVKKTEEWRLHVAFNKVICCQLKLRQSGNEQTADQKLIRNHDNGWVFCPRSVEELSESIKEEAVKAVNAVGLDFGAVDLIIGKDDNLPYVLEINTAPGIESPTLKQAYQAAFQLELM